MCQRISDRINMVIAITVGGERRNMTTWITVADIENQTGIPNATVRRYIRYHGHHVLQKKTGKSYIIDAQSVNVFKQIRDMYDRHMTTEQVEETLVSQGRPVTITVHDEQMTVPMSQAVERLQEHMNKGMAVMYQQIEELKQVVEVSRQEIAASRADNERLRDYIDERMNERDKMLTATMRDMLEQAQQQAQEKQKKRWWQFGR